VYFLKIKSFFGAVFELHYSEGLFTQKNPRTLPKKSEKSEENPENPKNPPKLTKNPRKIQKKTKKSKDLF
jgi:hypothetical protein